MPLYNISSLLLYHVLQDDILDEAQRIYRLNLLSDFGGLLFGQRLKTFCAILSDNISSLRKHGHAATVELGDINAVNHLSPYFGFISCSATCKEGVLFVVQAL